MSKRHKAFDGHEYVIALTDEKSGLKAYVAIHSTVLGPAHGGTRMKIYKNDNEALDDALHLSKAMSYKSALAKLPYGGAKGVIILKDNSYDQKKLLKAYAQKLEKLGGLFQTGTDVGLTDDDTKWMSKYSQYILGLPKKNDHSLSTSSCAALGVFYAIKAAVKLKYGNDSLAGRTVGVKGVGKLGTELVRLLHDAGATLLIADINESKTKLLQAQFPDLHVVSHEEIHKLPMHIYSPCALGNEFNQKNVKNLKCEVIVGGANNQLANDKVGDKLFKQGLIYVPDYIANAGGLIFVCEDLEADGFHEERVQKRLRSITDTVTMVLTESSKSGRPTNRVADEIAQDKISKANT